MAKSSTELFTTQSSRHWAKPSGNVVDFGVNWGGSESVELSMKSGLYNGLYNLLFISCHYMYQECLIFVLGKQGNAGRDSPVPIICSMLMWYPTFWYNPLLLAFFDYFPMFKISAVVFNQESLFQQTKDVHSLTYTTPYSKKYPLCGSWFDILHHLRCLYK